jgi:transforming growth factor-beta-induced protein
MKKILITLLLVVTTLSSTFAAGVRESSPLTQQDIVDLASRDGRFSTLVAALGAANLVDTLRSAGPFTVFAPTDDAFAKLPPGTVEALLNDIPTLTSILLYHVVPGKVMASDVVSLTSAGTALGTDLQVSLKDGGVLINDSRVLITDLQATNGVIHVIDTVLLPPAKQPNIVEIAVADGRFTTLTAALGAANLVETLQGQGPFTVFAPTDDAFAKLPAGTIQALLNDIPTLTNILLYHVVSGNVMAADVVGLTRTTAVNGKSIGISMRNGSVFLNDSKVIITDITAENGVIHVIDDVLLP